MQPDQCQKRQKVCNDVSLHRLCRYRGQNEEQTERGKQRQRERMRTRETDRETESRRKQIQTKGEDRNGSEHREMEQV